MREYIPKEIAAKLEAARARATGLEGERRIVTILFCDVKGSTAMADQLDPEEWAEIMNGAFQHLIAPIYAYEGVVARLMGDAILAFFGAPIGHEDDPQRAVLAALDIVEGIRGYREEVKREHGLEFDVRVGINTGLVVVGEVGSDLRVEYTAMGDAVNLAARMEQTARPGTVQVTAETYRLVAPLFECQALDGIEVKGKLEPVRAYRVVGRKAQPGRLRGIAGREAPLIGRERELETLRGALAELAAGRGRVCCLIGEAGLGKSRLIAELRGGWAHEGPRYWGESRAVSYESTRPYAQFREHLHQLCDLRVGDSSGDVRAKIARVARSLAPPEAARIEWALEVLLGVERPAERPSLEGEALKRELFAGMRVTWRAQAASVPTVLVFDDLHWSDAASLELLRELFSLVGEVPLLFLCAFRPDPAAPSWPIAETPGALHVALEPLASSESAALVDHLLAASDVRPELRRQILDRTEGNPFFVEEAVRAFVEGGDRAAGVAIPGNVRALLVARIDRLEEAPRRTLQLASVIGRTFEERIVRAIAEANGDPGEHLRTLARADLIREVRQDGEPEYAFRHALTQEAAYGSILLKRRRELHRRVGEALERLYAERLEEHASLLGHHFSEAHDERAQRYETLAGDGAYRLYANAEAIAHYGRALEVAARREATQDELLHLHTRLGRALELSGRNEDALANYDHLEAAAEARGDRALQLSALLAKATLRSYLNPVYDPAQASALSTRALELARAIGDRAAESRILWSLMLLGASRGEGLEDAIDCGQRSLAIARELGLREQMAFTLNDLDRVYMPAGNLAGARAALEEARGLWRALDNRPMLADNLGASAFAHYLAGDYDASLAFSDEGYAISASIGNLWGQSYTRRPMGFIYLERGEPARGIAEIEGMIRLGEQAGLTPVEVLAVSELAWEYACLGELERALALSRRGCARSPEMPRFRAPVFAIHARIQLRAGDVAGAAETLRRIQDDFNPRDLVMLSGLVVHSARAELALARRDAAAASAHAAAAVESLRAAGVRTRLADALRLQAETLRALGRESEAKDLLQRARRHAEAIGSRRSLWPVLAALGDGERARGIVRSIADHAGDLRASFLALPDVRAVLT